MQKFRLFLILMLMNLPAENLYAQKNQPAGLMCDLLAFPETTRILNHQPVFGWIYSSTQKNDRQIAWQILVAATLEELDKNIGTMWDSGQVFSDRSINIKYNGKPLLPGASYCWQVRTWDSQGKASSYSEPQLFRMGNQLYAHATSTYSLVQNIVPAKAFVEKSPGHYFVDFGKAAFGTIEIDVPQSCAGDSFTIHLGEKLKDGNTIDRNPGGTIRYRKIRAALATGQSTLRVKIPPDKRNTGERAIKMPPEIGEVMPFRYGEIEKSPARLDKDSVRMISVNYPFDDNAAYFKCSDPVLNDVWELCKYSIKATSFCGVYVDGDRERIPYEADAYINQLCHYSVDREFAMARYSHEYLITYATWPTEWILHSVLMAWADYLNTGESSSLAFYYDDLKAKTLLPLARADGLISTQTGLVTRELLQSIHLNDNLRDIVDWPPGSFMFGGIGERDDYKMGKINTVVNAFHFKALELMSKIAVALQKENDAEFFQRRAELVRESINATLFDPGRGIYIDCEDSTHAALHANMFPLAFGIVPPERQKSVVDFIKSRGMACSVYGAQYLLEALYNAGEAGYALALMTNRDDRSWPHMLYDVGSTITLEAWDIKYKKNLDWNHAWGAAPANVIPRFLLGVLPLEPGYRTFSVKPQVADLAFVNAKIPTIRGPIEMRLEQNDKSYQMTLSVPGNSAAVVYLPALNEDGRVLVDHTPTAGLPEGDFIRFENIGSGKHLFVLQKD